MTLLVSPTLLGFPTMTFPLVFAFGDIMPGFVALIFARIESTTAIGTIPCFLVA